MAERAPLRVHLVMLAVVATWGAAFTAIKIGLEALSPWHLTLYRFAVAAPLFAALLVLAGVPRFDRADRWKIAFVSVFSVAGYHFALNYGETAVSAGTAAIVVATSPLWTALISARLLRESITSFKLAGIALALAGVVVTVTLGAGRAIDVSYGLGALVVLMAPIVWACVSVVSKPLVLRYGAIPFSASTTLLGTALLLPILALGPGPVLALPAGAALAVLFLGLFATVGGYVGFNYALRHLTPTETMAYVYLNPLFALLWGALFAGEAPTAFVLAGAALVLAGVALVNWRR
ncbi:MAG TPA: EamA family transporter [Candidatus Thermoplasmatota archaeon]|nr:EamA family transporter [Candidatus Thermoplasmatota archaeon]